MPTGPRFAAAATRTASVGGGQASSGHAPVFKSRLRLGGAGALVRTPRVAASGKRIRAQPARWCGRAGSRLAPMATPARWWAAGWCRCTMA